MRDIATNGAIDDIQRALEREGIGLRLDSDLAVLQIDEQTVTRPWAWVPARHRATHRAPTDTRQPVILLGSRITTSTADRARKDGDWYADAQGQAYVRAPGLRIHVHAARPHRDPGDDREGRHARGTNLLSARRAQVVFCLLTWPELVDAPVRHLAEAAGVSVSLAHSARAALAEDRHLLPGHRGLDRRDELVERWAAAFPLGLGRALELGRFVGNPVPDAWLGSERPMFVSGEYATSALQGPDLTLYVPALDPRAVLRSRWRRSNGPGDRENITLRRIFWTTPWADAARDTTGAGYLRTVPPLLLYADLLASRDPRQREVALSMREDLHGPTPR